MASERRQYPRVAKRFEGGWSGSSGRGHCIVTDLSLGGCFVESRATPAGGDTVISMQFGTHETSLAGAVVYAEPGMGFGVQFRGLTEDQRHELGGIVESLRTSLAS